MVILQGKHNICILIFFFFFTLSDNYQVVFQTGCTFSYVSEEIHEDVDSQKKNPIKVDITWILLLRYYIHLQRINNMSKLLGRPLKEYIPFQSLSHVSYLEL